MTGASLQTRMSVGRTRGQVQTRILGRSNTTGKAGKAQGSPAIERQQQLRSGYMNRSPYYGPGFVPAGKTLPLGTHRQERHLAGRGGGASFKCLSSISQMPCVRIIATLDKNGLWTLPWDSDSICLGYRWESILLNTTGRSHASASVVALLWEPKEDLRKGGMGIRAKPWQRGQIHRL